MSEISHRAFLGDAERDFSLGSKQLRALEDVTEVGLGALYQRLIRGEFRFTDLTEVIRHGLIGGGASTSEAENMIRHWVLDRPIAETYPLALDILDRRWNGAPVEAVEQSNPPEGDDW